MPIATFAIGLHTVDGRKPSVAVIDGNPTDALITSLLVERFGCAALKAASGEAALALVRRTDHVDLVLIDLSIADMDGVVAALLIRETARRRDLPIVPLVSRRDDSKSIRSRAAGFAGPLMKPYSPRQLYAAMDAALARAKPPVLRADA